MILMFLMFVGSIVRLVALIVAHRDTLILNRLVLNLKKKIEFDDWFSFMMVERIEQWPQHHWIVERKQQLFCIEHTHYIFRFWLEIDWNDFAKGICSTQIDFQLDIKTNRQTVIATTPARSPLRRLYGSLQIDTQTLYGSQFGTREKNTHTHNNCKRKFLPHYSSTLFIDYWRLLSGILIKEARATNKKKSTTREKKEKHTLNLNRVIGLDISFLRLLMLLFHIFFFRFFFTFIVLG